MKNLDFISYLKRLKPEDWQKMATDEWTVKDVVAHMVGWEKGDVEVIRKSWEAKEEPWFLKSSSYKDFNYKNVEYYKNYSPEKLIEEWQYWQDEVEKEVEKIGWENIEKHPDKFGWLLEEGEGSHYEHHYNQIKKAVE